MKTMKTMKRVVFILPIGLLLFASCRKDRTCTCTYANGSTDSKNYTNMTKKLAKADCDSYDAYYPGGCDLK